MKRSVLFLVLAAVVAFAPAMFAQNPPPEQPQQQAQTEKTHTMEAEIVSVDASARTITYKPVGAGSGAGSTAPSDPQSQQGQKASTELTASVEGNAVNALQDLKAGDRVTLTFRGEETSDQTSAGAQKVVIDIVKSASSAPKS